MAQMLTKFDTSKHCPLTPKHLNYIFSPHESYTLFTKRKADPIPWLLQADKLSIFETL